MDALLHDLKFAYRLLVKRPGFSTIAVLSLALGIGANTVIFSLVNQLFLQPLPIAEPARVVALSTVDERAGAALGGNNPLSHLNWVDIREQNTVFSEVASYDFSGVSVAVEGEAEMQPALVVSGNYFHTLGVRPQVGRFFLPEEDEQPGTHPVVVLHDQFWREQLGADTAVSGRLIRINGQPFTVVGVAPPGFHGVNIGFQPALWMPQSMNAVARPDEEFNWYDERRGLFLFAVARLADGVDLSAANANLALLGDRLEQEYPNDNEGRGFAARPIAEASLFNRQGTVSGTALLMATVGLVLLIACVNVANLLLARAIERRREIAVRLAAGIPRARLVRQLLTESVTVALLGGLLGIALALVVRGWLGNLFTNLPGLPNLQLELTLDPVVLGFTVVLSLLVGLLFGLLPAIQASRPELVSALRDQGEGLLPPGRRGRSVNTRSVLVVAQLALSMVALTAAGLFVRSFAAAQEIDLGYESERLVNVGFNVGMQGYGEEQGRQFYRDLVQRAAAIPGVQRATVAQAGPLQGSFLRSVLLDGGNSEERTFVQVNSVGPEYFEVMGIPMVSGRPLGAADRAGSVAVVVLNQTAAERFWPGERAVGRRFAFFGMEPVEVVGVARDVKYQNPGEDPQPYAYLPLEQQYVAAANLVVRTEAEPASVLLALQSALREVEPDLALVNPGTVETLVANALAGQRFIAVFLAVFGGVALLLAAIGIYGVMAYIVRQRRREIGIRMALGAERESVLRMVLSQGMGLAGLGLIAGVVLALLTLRLFSQLLFVATSDPLTLGVTAALLLLVAGVATLLPAARAARTDPVVVLRPQ